MPHIYMKGVKKEMQADSKWIDSTLKIAEGELTHMDKQLHKWNKHHLHK